jgi:D-alanyl-D-alanine carboxypeptidase (penicillin-binding protein 5/6)
MLSRRLTLTASVALISAPAWAQQQPQGQRRPQQNPPRPQARPRARETTPGSPADTPLGPLDTAAKWAYIEDFQTGATLLEKQSDEDMPPSSMTKLMTIYLVYERLKEGRLRLTDELPVSEKAWKMGGSKMFVQVGTTVKVEDLIRGVIVQSGNDACVVLAEALAGSEDQFAELMTQKGKQLGLTRSVFKNATGWPDPEQKMSARDIATLARRIIRDFPEHYHYDSEKSFKYNGIDQPNRNPMVQKGTADGLKTGHTEAGGYGLVASSLRNGRRLIMVLNGMTTMRERAEEAERLMDWSFANFENVTLFAAAEVVDRVPVWLGVDPTVALVTGRDLVVTMPKTWKRNANVKLRFDSPVTAPVSKGDALGKLLMTGQGVPPMEVTLLAAQDVPRLGLPARAMAVVTRWFTGG